MKSIPSCQQREEPMSYRHNLLQKLHRCWECPYFRQAQRDPAQAQTICPVCGITLLPGRADGAEEQEEER